jgi:hypothetical protein
LEDEAAGVLGLAMGGVGAGMSCAPPGSKDWGRLVRSTPCVCGKYKGPCWPHAINSTLEIKIKLRTKICSIKLMVEL